MRRLTEIILLFLLLPEVVFSQHQPGDNKRIADSLLNKRGELYIAIPASTRKSAMESLSSVTPIRKTDSLIYFNVNSEEFRKIEDAGINYFPLNAPSMLSQVKMATTINEILEAKGYPTYALYLQLMQYFRDTYPDLCTIDTIGKSPGGRLILAARLQKGQYKAGERPLVFYSSTMHGDEVVGYSLMLMLIDDILKNANTSSQISGILNNLTVVINPLSNPDGSYFMSDTSLYGSRRRNLSNIDLNRNFPDVRLGMAYTYSGVEPENVDMMKYMEKFHPDISANFHTGAEVLNYPWDSYSSAILHADNNWFIEICRDYVTTARSVDPNYLRLYPEGYVFGYDWYPAYGTRQDFVTFNLRGREVTIELSDITLPDISLIPGLWEKNHQSLLDYIEKAEFGIFGTVTNIQNGNPIVAKVEIPGYDRNFSEIYSQSSGNFFRYPAEGDYILQVSAEGFKTETVTAHKSANSKTLLNVQLTPAQDIKVYPAGIREIQIDLMFDDSDEFIASLYDLSGRLVMQNKYIGKSGLLGNPEYSGIYILKIKSNTQNRSMLVFF